MSFALAEPQKFRPRTLIDLVQHRSLHIPDRLAFTASGHEPGTHPPALTFAGLECRARELAAGLQQRAQPGDRILIAVPTGLDFITAFTGCLLAGVIGVPVPTPANARQLPRLRAIAADSGARFALTTADLAQRFPDALEGVAWLTPDTLALPPHEWHRPALQPEDIAFLQYTSGSTGSPKGVMVSHANVLSNVAAIHAAVPLAAGDAVVSWLPMHHDMGLVGKVLFPIYAGAHCLQMTPAAFLAQPLRWLRALTAHRARLTCAPNFAYELCAARATPQDKAALDLSSLEFALNGAEPVRADTLRRFAAAFADCGLRAQALVPVYGLAESTLLVSAARPGPGATVSISRAALSRGQALAAETDADTMEVVSVGQPPDGAQRIRIVDPASLLCQPDDRVGEVWVQGPSVTRGYWGHGRYDARASFGQLAGEDWLRTGDLGFMRAGQLHVVGRVKDVMIFSGANVHPQDVEASVEALDPAFRAAGCAAFAIDAPQGPRLVLLQEIEPRGQPRTEGLAARVLAELAEVHGLADVHAMWLLKIGSIPRTTSGKIQRHRCRELFETGQLEPVWAWQADAAPSRAIANAAPLQTPVQSRLALRWQEILGVAAVGADDDFFQLGGHSLAALQLVQHVREDFGVELPMLALFEHPTLRALAAVIEALPTQAPAALTPAGANASQRHAPFPLTEVQQAYWLGRGAHFALGNVAAHAYRELRVAHFDPARFTRALQALVARHDMLRAVVHPDGTQQVLDTVPGYEPALADLRGHDPEAAQAQLQRIRDDMSHRIHAPDVWPLFEVRATRVCEVFTHLHLGFDLLIMDAWSGDVLLDELNRLYANPQAALPPLTRSFRDCVLADLAAQPSPAHQASVAHWRQRLPELPPPPQLPLAVDPFVIETPRFQRRSHMLPAAPWQALQREAAALGVTPSAVLLTAFAETLALWSRHPRFTLNLTFFNRRATQAGLERVIGDFTSLLLLDVATDGDAGFAERVRRLQTRLWTDLPHGSVSGVQLLRELRAMSVQTQATMPATMPVVFTSMLGHQRTGPADAAEAANGLLASEVVHEISQTPQVWLDHQASERQGQLLLAWDAVEALFPEHLLDDMFSTYCGLVQRLGSDAAAWSLPPSLLVQAPHASTPEPLFGALESPLSADTLQSLFARQARLRPEHAALVCADGTLSYGELQARAQRLGEHLARQGAGPGTLVAVEIDKGAEQVVAVLGVLHVGAAYLPMDPCWPAYRRGSILAQSQAAFRLTRSEHGEVDGIAIERLGNATVSPELAYVIYTSGSTGSPKGVMVSHGAVVNTLLDINARYCLTPGDRVLALSQLSFDLSVFDIFGTLAAGATIVMPPPGSERDPAAWLELLRRERVTVWNSVPALLEMLVAHAEAASPGNPGLPAPLRLVMLSGDWIPVTLPDRLRALCPSAQVISLGGATEAAIWSIAHPIGAVDPGWHSIPYGRALHNQHVHVLDAALRRRPVGVAGELYIGGAGLANGYLHDPQKTREHFIAHPRTGEQLYRTGDWGRLLPDGNIEFLGRDDAQVKVLGHRIELGEIEATLNTHPDVRGAAVVVRGRHNSAHLAAYMVPREPAQLDLHDLTCYLHARLPAYMVPSHLMTMDALPLSANGKVDRGALPEIAPPKATSPAAALDEVERRIQHLVESALQQSPVEVAANLLTLGANSIDVVRIGNALHVEMGFRPSYGQMFADPSIRGLAAAYRASLSAATTSCA